MPTNQKPNEPSDSAACSHRWIVVGPYGNEYFDDQGKAVQFLEELIEDERRDALRSGEWSDAPTSWFIAKIKGVVEEVIVENGSDYQIKEVV